MCEENDNSQEGDFICAACAESIDEDDWYLKMVKVTFFKIVFVFVLLLVIFCIIGVVLEYNISARINDCVVSGEDEFVCCLKVYNEYDCVTRRNLELEKSKFD